MNYTDRYIYILSVAADRAGAKAGGRAATESIRDVAWAGCFRGSSGYVVSGAVERLAAHPSLVGSTLEVWIIWKALESCTPHIAKINIHDNCAMLNV